MPHSTRAEDAKERAEAKREDAAEVRATVRANVKAARDAAVAVDGPTVAGSIPDTHEIQVAYEGRKFVAHSTAPDFDTAVAKAEALARGNGGKPVRVVKDGQELRVFSRAEG